MAQYIGMYFFFCFVRTRIIFKRREMVLIELFITEILFEQRLLQNEKLRLVLCLKNRY